MILGKIKSWFASKINVDYKRLSQSVKNMYNDAKELIKSAGDYVDELLYASPGLVGVYTTLKDYHSSGIKKSYGALKQDYYVFKDVIKSSFKIHRKEKEAKDENSADTAVKDVYLDDHALGWINDMVHKGNHSYKVIDDLVKEYHTDTKTLIRDIAKAKVDGKYPDGQIRLHYDRNYAPEGMNDEMIQLYGGSDATLREISAYLEKKYGMHVARSTVSKHARREFGKRHGKNVKSRKAAKSIKKGKR